MKIALKVCSRGLKSERLNTEQFWLPNIYFRMVKTKWRPFCSVFWWSGPFQNGTNKMAILFKTIVNLNKKVAILFGFTMVWLKNGWDDGHSYFWPFQNRTIGNLNFKTFGIPVCLVFQFVHFSIVDICKYFNIFIILLYKNV